MNEVWWTDADQAELDLLLHELTVGYDAHRARCSACQPGDCPVFVAWREHLTVCLECLGDEPLTHGPPCPRKRRFIDHGRDCARCNVCPSVSLAVELVLQWRVGRELRSRAAWLRAERVRIEGAA
jgi:hypothetical protein